jgi:hypothetical protein
MDGSSGVSASLSSIPARGRAASEGGERCHGRSTLVLSYEIEDNRLEESK